MEKKSKFRIQALHNLLPTQREMHRRLHTIYPNGWCRCCNKGLVETNDHVWTCEFFEKKRDTIFNSLILNLTTACDNAHTTRKTRFTSHGKASFHEFWSDCLIKLNRKTPIEASSSNTIEKEQPHKPKENNGKRKNAPHKGIEEKEENVPHKDIKKQNEKEKTKENNKIIIDRPHKASKKMMMKKKRLIRPVTKQKKKKKQQK